MCLAIAVPLGHHAIIPHEPPHKANYCRLRIVGPVLLNWLCSSCHAAVGSSGTYRLIVSLCVPVYSIDAMASPQQSCEPLVAPRAFLTECKPNSDFNPVRSHSCPADNESARCGWTMATRLPVTGPTKGFKSCMSTLFHAENSMRTPLVFEMLNPCCMC